MPSSSAENAQRVRRDVVKRSKVGKFLPKTKNEYTRYESTRESLPLRIESAKIDGRTND
jgi:hypothetical protein